MQRLVLLLQAPLGDDAIGHVPENPLYADHQPVRPEHWRFDHLHIEPVAGGSHVLLDNILGHASAGDFHVVVAIVGGEFGGVEVEVGAADDLVERLAEGLAEVAIAEAESAGRVLPEDVLRQRLHQRVVHGFGALQAGNGGTVGHVELVESVGGPARERDEHDDRREGEKQHGQLCIEAAFADDRQRRKADQRRHEDRRRQQPPQHQSADGIRQQRRDRRQIRPGGEDRERQRVETDRGIERHADEAMELVKRADVVGIAEQRQQRHAERREREPWRKPSAKDSAVHRQQGPADECERDGGVGSHHIATKPAAEEDLIQRHRQSQAGTHLHDADGQDCRGQDVDPESPGRDALGKCQERRRQSRRDERDRGQRVHRNPCRMKQTLEQFVASRPPVQHQRRDADDQTRG